jgi:hypothetical protein
MSRVVDVYDLYNGDEKFDYSNQCEWWVVELVAGMRGWTDVSKPPTDGYHPAYDITAKDSDGKTIKAEVKFSGYPNLFVECARADGTPSGIETSTADYYICINPGKSNIRDKWVEAGKVRVIPKDILYTLTYDLLSDDPSLLKTFGASNNGPGSKGINISPKLLSDDGWIASVAMRRVVKPDGKQAVQYDLSTVLQQSRRYPQITTVASTNTA